jgi:hypothetical protein
MIGYGNTIFLSNIVLGASISPGPVNKNPPVISGRFVLNGKASCSTGDWISESKITYSYQWTIDGNNIIGATEATFQITAEELFKNLACNVTATNENGSTVQASNIVIPTE